LKVAATFVTSAARTDDLPGDGTPEVALVGRSNVGKSSLINALVRQRIARTSAAPGKTRLANIYRVQRGSSAPMYLIDLPGYGYARGDRSDIEATTRALFGRDSRERQEGLDGKALSALLLVDSRHPGLESDMAAWHWMHQVVGDGVALVATKIDKLARGQRIRAMRELESVFDAPVVACSAVTGEGLDDLWKLMDRLANSQNPRSSSRPRATARQHPKK